MRLFDYNFPVQESVEPKNNKPDADVIYLLESILESVQGKVSRYNKDEKVQFKLKGLLNQFVKENNVLLDRKDLKLVCKVDEASTYENLNIVLNDKGYLSEALHPIINDLVKEVYEDFRVDLEKHHYYIDTGNGDNSKLRIARESNYVKVEEMDADLVATLAAPILAYILLLISLFFADKQGKKRNQALKKIVNYYERFHEKDIPIPFEDMRVEVLTLQHDSKIPKEYKSFKIFECPKMFESEKNGERRYDVNVYRVLMYKGKPVILIEGFLKHQHLDVYGNTWVDWVDNIPYQALDPKLKKFEDYYLMKILVSYLDATNLNLIKNDEGVKRFVKNFEKELQSNPNYEEAKKIAKEKKRLIKESYYIDEEYGDYIYEEYFELSDEYDDSETVGESLEFVSCNEGFIKRIREVINQRNWKRKAQKNDYDALTKDVTPYVRKEVHSKGDFDRFYRNNDFCIECLPGDDECCQIIANMLAAHYDIKTPVEVFVITGKDMNKIYDLAGDNAYQDNVHHVIVPLDTLKNTKDIVPAKGTIKARYFNDVVDNNEYREYLAGRHKASQQIQWLIDYWENH